MSRLKHGVLIIENDPRFEDNRSEGNLLKEFFLQAQIPFDLFQIHSIEDFYIFLRWRKPFYKNIHISCHGTGEGLKFPLLDGDFGKDEIDLLKDCFLKNRNIMLTACSSGKKNFGKMFISASGCNVYIAPLSLIDWYNSSMFSMLYYKALFIDNKKPWFAFKYAKKVLGASCSSFNYYDAEGKKKKENNYWGDCGKISKYLFGKYCKPQCGLYRTCPSTKIFLE